jgi:hypothetical protein
MNREPLDTIGSALRLYESELQSVITNLTELGDPVEDIVYFVEQLDDTTELLEHLAEYYEGCSEVSSKPDLKDFGLYVEVVTGS